MESSSEDPRGALNFHRPLDTIMFSIGMFLFGGSFLVILYWLIKNRELLAMMAHPIFTIDHKNNHDSKSGGLELKSNGSSSSSSSLKSVQSRTEAVVTHTTSV